MLYFTDILPGYILFIFLCFSFPPKNTTSLFFNECPQRKTLSDDWMNSLIFYFIYNIYCCYSYDVQPCFIYMILILPRHYLIYDPDSSPPLSYIWSWFLPVTLIYDPDSSPPLSYIWSWFFPATVLYMILILSRHCLIYDPDSSPSVPNNTDLKDNWNLSFIQCLEVHFTVHGRFIYIAWQFFPYGEEEVFTQNKTKSLNRVSSCKPLGRTWI